VEGDDGGAKLGVGAIGGATDAITDDRRRSGRGGGVVDWWAVPEGPGYGRRMGRRRTATTQILIQSQHGRTCGA
jgi:hypothetical protein